ncbi:phosphotransferase family protein [Actinoalloteichus sp. GBA129-24]|uniref:Phosphotransferase family protein n=2 Tax=Pseudonocardiaceae TaxID=2070 RepID=A0AAC9PTL1_9PSEU|nr:phosphotransferase family protein [Actinoalloteichus fjordicus]APU22059.1 phosphotransferase family protein [Actinoalloteichus sp. GBA129-24]
MPRPVPPRSPAAPLLADLPIEGGSVSFLVHEWCAGSALTAADITPELAEWVGRTLAALHSLPLDVRPAEAPSDAVHSVDEWRDWLDDAAGDTAPDFVDSVRVHLPDVARATEIVAAALVRVGDGPTPVLTHRDLKPDNVLRTSGTPILVDWDGAGLDVAEWEAVRAASAFRRAAAGAGPALLPSAGPDSGGSAIGLDSAGLDSTGLDSTGSDSAGSHLAGSAAMRSAAAGNVDVFSRVLRSYTAAGGRRIAPTAEAFAGLLRTQLGGAAWMLFRALGHRPVTPPERAAAHEHALELLADLHTSLTEIPTWTRWLAETHDPA